MRLQNLLGSTVILVDLTCRPVHIHTQKISKSLLLLGLRIDVMHRLLNVAVCIWCGVIHIRDNKQELKCECIIW